MNTVLRFIIMSVVLIGALSLLGALVPDSFTANIDGAIIYFFGFLNYLQPIVNIDVLFSCIKLVVNFGFGVMAYFMGWTLFHYISG